MDYRKKVISTTLSSQKCKNEDDEDDLEALRLAALQTLRVKDVFKNKRRPTHQNRGGSFKGSQSSRPHYNQARGDHFLHRQQRQNGVRHNYFPKSTYRNPNLIEIVPQGEISSASAAKENINTQVNQGSSDGSKFQRYIDNASGSEDDDTKDIDSKIELKIEEKEYTETEEVVTDKENGSDMEENFAEKTAEEVDEDRLLNDDDDDILLMADLEEEDSLERLMDEMEREIKDDKMDITDKKFMKKEKLGVKKVRGQNKQQEVKVKEGIKDKTDFPDISKSSTIAIKSEQRPLSPRVTLRKRSVSPKLRPWRKASPRTSPPKRSPTRLLKKSVKETSRYRSPRNSPLRYSPRSPKVSPRPKSPQMSPRRSPDRKSPLSLRKLSPKGRSPRLSPRSRSPRIRCRSSRSRSRSLRRSPRKIRSRSPRYSPHRYSPRSRTRSPRSRSPRSPRRRISRSRSPRSPRRASPRHRSPKRLSPRYRSPRMSPIRSPWSSPRRSPRISPKRFRSPRRSPKDSIRKPRTKSVTPDRRSYSPQNKDMYLVERKSPEMDKAKAKKENILHKPQVSEAPKEEPVLDPILEARRRKFESVTPIDPINANKTIKLSNKKEEVKTADIKKLEIKKIEIKSLEPPELIEELVEKRKKLIVPQRKEQKADLLLNTTYDFDEIIDNDIDEAAKGTLKDAKEVCFEVQSVNKEKKKKKDKEIYQIGKMKGEISIPERIKKEKLKKRKIETAIEGASEIVVGFEDITADDEGDLRAELSRRRAERLNRSVPMQSARLLQSAFKGVVNEVAKNNAKINQRLVIKGDEKSTVQKEVRRVTVLHRTLTDFNDSKGMTESDEEILRIVKQYEE